MVYSPAVWSPSSHGRKVLQQLAVVSPVSVSTYPNYLRGVDIIYNYQV